MGREKSFHLGFQPGHNRNFGGTVNRDDSKYVGLFKEGQHNKGYVDGEENKTEPFVGLEPAQRQVNEGNDEAGQQEAGHRLAKHRECHWNALARLTARRHERNAQS